MISTPSFARITNPSELPSGTSTVLAKPKRSTQNGKHGSIDSTVSKGVSLCISPRVMPAISCESDEPNVRPPTSAVLEKRNRHRVGCRQADASQSLRSEEHTSVLQSPVH